jgi:hypothetical protein
MKTILIHCGSEFQCKIRQQVRGSVLVRAIKVVQFEERRNTKPMLSSKKYKNVLSVGSSRGRGLANGFCYSNKKVTAYSTYLA